MITLISKIKQSILKIIISKKIKPICFRYFRCMKSFANIFINLIREPVVSLINLSSLFYTCFMLVTKNSILIPRQFSTFSSNLCQILCRFCHKRNQFSKIIINRSSNDSSICHISIAFCLSVTNSIFSNKFLSTLNFCIKRGSIFINIIFINSLESHLIKFLKNRSSIFIIVGFLCSESIKFVRFLIDILIEFSLL